MGETQDDGVEELKLTLKLESFCREYVNNGFNATQAAIAAGYSKESASAMGTFFLAKDKVKIKIDKLLKIKNGAASVTRDWKLDMLRKCASWGAQRDIDGKRQLKSVTSAIDILNKMQADYAPTSVRLVDAAKDDDVLQVKDLTDRYLKDF